MKRKTFALAVIYLLFIMSVPAYAKADSQNPQTMTGRIPINAREQIAAAAAISGTVVCKILDGQQFEASPGKGDQRGCIPVTVMVSTSGWEDSYKYIVCDGLITEEAESIPERGRVDIDDFIAQLAKKAQESGMAQGVFNGFTVKAVVLPHEQNCEVEISVFKGKHLTRKSRLPCY